MKSDAIKKGRSARQPGARHARSPKPIGTRRNSTSPTSSSSVQPQDASLSKMLEKLKPHDHLCLIYESHEEWRAAAVPFISIGLKRGEKCIYVVDTNTADEIRKYLDEEGVDAAAAEKSGQLAILHETEAYTREGSFDPDKMIALLISETEKAIAEGYPALRITGEMTWVLRGHPGSEKLLEYEAKLNRDLFPKYPCLAICQYDRWKFDPEIIKGVIMTHPLLVRSGRVYHNVYYIEPEEFLNRKRAELEVQHWLNNVERERQIQETLQQSEERYRTITEQSLQGLVVVQDFHIVSANAAFAKISGYSIEELLSLPPAKVQAMIHPADRALVWGRLKDRLAGRTAPPRYEYRGIRKDQTVRWLEMHASLIDYDGKPAILGAIIDITERKRAEETLREGEERYRTLFENMAQGAFYQQADGVLVDGNQAVLEMFGVTRDQFLGRTSMDPRWKVIHEDGSDFLSEQHPSMEALRTGKPVRGVVAGVFNPRKEDYVWLSINAIPQFKAGEDRPYQVFVTLHDITERKRAEEKLKKAMAELERSNAELERFAYVASHDLQEPLRMVSSYVQLLERRYKDKLDADANDFIDYAMGGAERMQQLLNDLLTYSHIGTQAKPFKRTDMESVLKAALDNLQVAIKESKARVTHDPLPTLMADEGQMVQVLQNLIGNAVKFRGRKLPHIHVSAEQRDSEWVFSVKDNGIGIEPQHFDRIFLIFQRLHRDEYPGTGTGLAIAQKIVERHGGHMWVESQPGKGSTFYFSIKAKGKGNRHKAEGNS